MQQLLQEDDGGSRQGKKRRVSAEVRKEASFKMGKKVLR